MLWGFIERDLFKKIDYYRDLVKCSCFFVKKKKGEMNVCLKFLMYEIVLVCYIFV